MRQEDIAIGQDFYSDGNRWRCTDIGTRTVAAIRLDKEALTSFTGASTQRTRTLLRDEAESAGLFNGPPYAVAEVLFDEDSMEGCDRA